MLIILRGLPLPLPLREASLSSWTEAVVSLVGSGPDMVAGGVWSSVECYREDLSSRFCFI